ncbi:hypothetical protein [Frondihabitans sp. Leaf304]|uniref:hypothetical protein n=1 Tax=Frondihabitans sp. Leaf304 TaxID=1736329 RepID=UPI0006FF0BD2|nr:hypothetical protein [Frondihabitans sp. Leaf304]KQQ26740.1 hypothetical protein ASF54_12310 [Frondihabitans sp. Leaf304]
MTITTPPTGQTVAPAPTVWDYQTIAVARSEAEERLTALEVFGWTLQDQVPTILDRRTATFFLRRDRAIADRAALDALEAEHIDAVTEVERLQRSPERMARTVAIIAGLVGVAYMGGAVFAYLDGGGLTYYILAAVAFAHCFLPIPLKKTILKKRSASVSGRLAEQRQAAHDVLEAAHALRDEQAVSRSIRR